MTAMASWVKLLAVPGPTPGPWEATAAWAHGNPAAADMMAKTKRDMRDVAMPISCDEEAFRRYGRQPTPVLSDVPAILLCEEGPAGAICSLSCPPETGVGDSEL